MQFLEISKGKKRQGKLFRIRWEDEPKHNQLLCMVKRLGYRPTVVMYELHEQLLPTKAYTKEKTQTSTGGEVLCRLCGKVAESVAHALAGCSSLVRTNYLYMHNAALKILFFELLREHGLIVEVPQWYSPVMPKPAYQNTTSEMFGIFLSMQCTTKLEQIGSTSDLSATRGKESAHLKSAAHGLRVETRKMKNRHLSMGRYDDVGAKGEIQWLQG